MQNLKLAICIPVHNALKHFKKMISSLKENTSLKYSLFICDDASNYDTSQFIESLPAKRIIKHEHQQWFTRSVNDLLILSFLANYDYTFILNSDIKVSKGWETTLLDYFNNFSRVGLVGSVYTRKGPKFIFTHHPNYVTGHCWVIKTSILETTGILDERFIHIESDKDFCYRLNRFGFATIEDHKAKVSHCGGASWDHSLGTLSNIDERLINRKKPIFVFSHGPNLETRIKKLKEKYGLDEAGNFI